ncbi:YciI family protein [Nocardioides sp. CER19]|uniref:YciI family protein n=1 Tax=Nocardioides sp. CER19 TaxID=3038538 RepID=UPI00244D2756|nr:YciI family protein [Nocardioides sp. CER19]MDH2413438.1 YciI family protein [Nocardioides sp. CER19]
MSEVQFLVLLTAPDHFARWEGLSSEERDDAMASFGSFAKAVQERGEIVAGDALYAPAAARTVQMGPERVVTDGPFAETVEQLAGFYVIDVDSLETAVDLARLLPRNTAVEVRPTRGVPIR